MGAGQADSNGMLPVPNPTSSYWRSELHHLDSFRSTPSLPDTCEIAVIGAGIAGVSAVWVSLFSLVKLVLLVPLLETDEV